MSSAATGSLKDTLAAAGFAVAEGVLPAGEVNAVVTDIERAQAEQGTPWLRNVFDHAPLAAAVLQSPSVNRVLSDALGPGWFAVRCILFDKVPGANWHVGWHQDQCITVRERAEIEGFGPWSVKEGVVHVEPPAGVLDRMVTLRLHLDDCGEDNGPLKVVPGSHRHGRLSSEQARALRESNGVVTCTVARGGAVLMKPLTLHASRPAESPRHRRVLHIECAAEDLPAPLHWHERRAKPR